MSRSVEQTTVARPVTKNGIGLHSGATCAVTLMPAAPDAGIVFVSEAGVEIPATVDYVVAVDHAVTLGREGERISTVEHLLAAIWAVGPTNVRVQVKGPEAPACDGSAKEWVELLQEAGRRQQGTALKSQSLPRAIWAGEGDSWALAAPSSHLALGVGVEYEGTAAGRQTFWVKLTRGQFASELAPARTFALEHEYDQLRQAGLANGGSADNAFLVGQDGYSGPLRFPDEVARHKALDLTGDIALCGFAVKMHITAIRPGHRMNVALARAIRSAISSQRAQTNEGEGRTR
jgi:UDP-3-O-[3-hydroxymyristoyl] N-acetylglucosamine deacetylase